MFVPDDRDHEDMAPNSVRDDDRGQWYVVHAYSGQEKAIKSRLEKRIESMNMDDLIYEVIVPTDERIQVKNGKRVTVEERVFPGYILVRMEMTNESWHAVRNTPGVTGFVSSGTTPVPLESDEVERIHTRMAQEQPRPKIDVEVGENIRVTSGPFDGFVGTVNEIDAKQGKVHVLVNMFGRETPVELDFTQVEKL
ncbi:MAG: transcription termination/antitermination protein NusG [Bacillota bacterium]